MTVGVVSAAARELTQEVLRIMLVQKLTLATATLLAAGLIAWGASAALVLPQEKPSQKSACEPNPPLQAKAETAVPQPEPNSLDSPGKVTVRGRVLAPDGRPVPGAKLYRTPAMDYHSVAVRFARVCDDRTGRPLPVPCRPKGPSSHSSTRDRSMSRPSSRPRRQTTGSPGWRFLRTGE